MLTERRPEFKSKFVTTVAAIALLGALALEGPHIVEQISASPSRTTQEIRIGTVGIPETIPDENMKHAADSRGSLAIAQDRYSTLVRIQKRSNGRRELLLSRHMSRAAFYGQSGDLGCIAIFDARPQKLTDATNLNDLSFTPAQFITIYCNTDGDPILHAEQFYQKMRLNGCFTYSWQMHETNIPTSTKPEINLDYALPPEGFGSCKEAY